MVDLEIRVNIDFNQLANNLPGIIEDFLGSSFADASISKSKEDISAGKIVPKLKKSTLDRRKRAGISGDRPLYATGALHDSLKRVKSGIEMKRYGKFHQEGFLNHGHPVDARPFIAIPKMESLSAKFRDEIVKSLKRKSPLVLKT